MLQIFFHFICEAFELGSNGNTTNIKIHITHNYLCIWTKALKMMHTLSIDLYFPWNQIINADLAWVQPNVAFKNLNVKCPVSANPWKACFRVDVLCVELNHVHVMPASILPDPFTSEDYSLIIYNIWTISL